MPDHRPPGSAYDLALSLLAHLADQPELARLAAKIAKAVSPCVAGPGYSCLRCGTETFSFTAAQSHAVRLLHIAWRRGTPDVKQEALLEAAGSSTSKASNLFKGNSALGRLIIKGEQRGTYRLCVPPLSTPQVV